MISLILKTLETVIMTQILLLTIDSNTPSHPIQNSPQANLPGEQNTILTHRSTTTTDSILHDTSPSSVFTPTPTHVPPSTSESIPSSAPLRSHPLVTRAQNDIHEPIQKLNLHTNTRISSLSHLSCNYLEGFRHLNWLNEMKDEYDELISNGTWVLVPQPHNTNVVTCIWLLKKKFNADGS